MPWMGLQCSDHTGDPKFKSTFKATPGYDPVFAHIDNQTARVNAALQTGFGWVLFSL